MRQFEKKVEAEMERAEDLQFIASAHQVQEMVNSAAWRDMVTFIEDHIEQCREALEIAEDLPKLRFIQGEITVAKLILALPEQLIEWDQIEQERRKENEQDSRTADL